MNVFLGALGVNPALPDTQQLSEMDGPLVGHAPERREGKWGGLQVARPMRRAYFNSWIISNSPG